MNTLKTFVSVITLIISVQISFAQTSAMKDPVSFKLKNGTTVIVAENTSTQRVFANLSFEQAGRFVAEKAATQEVFTTLLNLQLAGLNDGLSYSDKGFNLTTNSLNFPDLLKSMLTYINEPEFSDEFLTEAKSTIIAHLAARDKFFPENISRENVEKITLKEVKSYYDEINDPSQTFLTIVGNIKPAIAKNLTKKQQMD